MVNFGEMKAYMFEVVGAIHEVHTELGPGLNEYCYQEALEMELTEMGIPFQREYSFHPLFHGKTLNAEYRTDFICKGNIVLECKAVETLAGVHRAQLFNYMRLLNMPCGILVNFSPRYAEIERYLYDKELKNIMSIDGRPFQK